ncbi:MAG: GatB/YqeY domain-containing protein [Anaerolineae bacterium]
MGLKEQLQEDLKQAMREGDPFRRSAIRLALTSIKNAEVEKMGELDEGEILALLAKEAKQRREAIEQFSKGGRQDLVKQEEAELAILTAYLPPQMSREEIEEAARQAIQAMGATGMKQMGDVMRHLMAELRGRADGRMVNQVVRELLSAKD